jgi:hypothetical protein
MWCCEPDDGPLLDYLAALPPSQVSHTGPGGWIGVCNPRARHREDEQEGPHKDYDAAMKDVGDCITQGTPVSVVKKNKCIRDILQIAKQHGDTSGKWMLQVYRGDGTWLDELWRKIATATAEGRLGDCAKISPAGGASSDELLLCCCYTPDFSDKIAVKRLLHNLEKELKGSGGGGVEVKWGFKADVYTKLGIYSDRERGRPGFGGKLGTTIYRPIDAREADFVTTEMPWERKAPAPAPAPKPKTDKAAKQAAAAVTGNKGAGASSSKSVTASDAAARSVAQNKPKPKTKAPKAPVHDYYDF